MIIKQKGAMFGLDARIALAIFGALSVISGAALYSAIQTTNSVQWATYFSEITKATEQYYLDNGKQLPVYNTTNYRLYLPDLAINRESLTTWNGPYWNISYSANYYIKDFMTQTVHTNTYAHIYLRQSSTWAAMDDITTDEVCVANSTDCSEWIGIYGNNSGNVANFTALFNKLDEYIDGGDGALAGRLRYNTYGNDIIMYKGMNHTI